MKLPCRSIPLLALVVLVAIIIGCATMRTLTPQARLSAAQVAIATWHDASRLSAAMMIDAYGPPDRVEAYRLVWDDQGSCRRLTAWDAGTSNGEGVEDIECTVVYPVPAEKLQALEQLSPQLRVSLNGTELSARSGSQEVDRLMLNLAALVIAGLDPSAARRSYDNALSLQAAGKTPALMATELFRPTPKPNSPWPFRLNLAPGTLQRSPLWRNEPTSDSAP